MPLETDPIDFLLGDDGDTVISGPDVSLVSGRKAVAQKLRLVLELAMGEWFLNLGRGVPYLPNEVVNESQALLGQPFDQVKARAAFRSVLLAEPEVEEVLSLAVSFSSTRKMTVSGWVRTEFGDTAISAEVG